MKGAVGVKGDSFDHFLNVDDALQYFSDLLFDHLHYLNLKYDQYVQG